MLPFNININMNSKDKALLEEAYLKVLLKENPEPQSSNT